MQDDLLCTVPHTCRKPVRLQIFSSPCVETICLPNSPSPSGGPTTPPRVKKSACMTLLPPRSSNPLWPAIFPPLPSPVIYSNKYAHVAVTPSFTVYRAYLQILVFPFYKAQFGCSPSHVQIPRCIKSLHASIKIKFTNACILCMHALQLMHS